MKTILKTSLLLLSKVNKHIATHSSFLMLLISSCINIHLSVTLFTLPKKVSFGMSIMFGPSDNELFTFLLAWIYLYFAFIFEEYFLWIEFEASSYYFPLALWLYNLFFWSTSTFLTVLLERSLILKFIFLSLIFNIFTSIYLSITLERKACNL